MKVYKVQTLTLTKKSKIFFKSFDNFSKAAEYLNCSKRTLSRYIDKNKILNKKWVLFTKDINKQN